MKSIFTSIAICFFVLFGNAQNTGSLKDTTNLKEIIVVGERKLSQYQQDKTLSSIDDYLENSNRVTMIKRGNYAWEPTLNNMTSERLNVTISGMQIFGACTDKMDPITSYVDVSNLKKVSIASGQNGMENGNTIGGGIDLQLPQSKFTGLGLSSSLDLGYETNGNYKSTGLELEYSGNRFYINTDGIFRRSNNYKAGNNQEVKFSQFQKYNVSLQTGYKINQNNSLTANVIFDKATDIGYPALPMDVSLAKAIITSASHHFKNSSSLINSLETKLYYNSITHIMDDSQRPDVPIRMDMPGWSDTFGFFSKAKINQEKHELSLNINGFYNKSLAEMTMYPNDSNQPSMFMYTWPDVRTIYSGVFVKDEFSLTKFKTITASVRLGLHRNRIANQEGFESLKIFHPDLKNTKNRFLAGLSSTFNFNKNNYGYNFGLGYGQRAPSVSEGYGFYLFNSFDNFDYIGNPNLKNEKSVEANFGAHLKLNHFKIGIESSFFHINDYIIGEMAPNISPMTIGATGVKTYSALKHANIFDVYLNSNYHFFDDFSLNATLGYNYGKGSNNENLPLIKPFSYSIDFQYLKPNFNAAIQLKGNGNQSEYSSVYGEDQTPAYGILNLNLGHSFYVGGTKWIVKYGIENMLDAHYSTYADWNNIPRKGRNIFANISFIF